jgi:hypothetical protein
MATPTDKEARDRASKGSYCNVSAATCRGARSLKFDPVLGDRAVMGCLVFWQVIVSSDLQGTGPVFITPSLTCDEHRTVREIVGNGAEKDA